MTEVVDCNRIETDLALFIGGELSPSARTLVEVHLARCGACEALVQRLQGARTALRRGMDHSQEQAPDLWVGVRSRLAESGLLRPREAQPASESTITAPVAAPIRRMRWISLSAAAALIFAFGLWMGQRDSAPAQPSNAPVAGTSAGTRGTSDVRVASDRPSSGSGAVQLVGLRRLPREEAPLSTFAVPVDASVLSQPGTTGVQAVGGAMPASLHNRLGLQ